MPKYAKFLKGLLSNKTMLEEACTVTMNERCSTVLLNKLPSKEKDPRNFTIPCDIGHLHVNNALADLGASISLMPYTMYENLGLGEPKPIRMSLEQAYRIPIILGRPFLATAWVMIDVFNKKITLKAGNKEVLEKRKGAIAWKMSDIKGINPSFCTQKILMEESSKPVIQPQRRLSLKVQDVVKNKIVRLLDSGLIYPISDSPWEDAIWIMKSFNNFSKMHDDKMLARCEETNLVLNWEKCHFMVKEGIVLGHKIFGKGIEVDKAKIDVIAKLPYPTNVKGVRSFLGHAGFYRRFIKDFSMISKPMTQLLMKDVKFDFFKGLGAVLGQRIDVKFKPIYYASKTLNVAQAHYTTTEKELLAVVFSFDKFRPYLILSKIVVYTDHSTLKYLSRVENLAADHLSRLKNLNMGELTKEEITDKFFDEHLMILKAKLNDDEPWYADYVNYIVGKVVPPKWTLERRKWFFSQVRNYFWDKPYAFRLYLDNVMRKCIVGDEILEILAHCHSGPTGGHHSASVTGRKVYKAGFYWPSIFKDAKDYGLDFMGPFPDSWGIKYILVAMDYVSKWVEAQALPKNDSHVVVKFLKGLFARFEVPKDLISDRGTHFFNSQLEKALLKYRVTHKISTAYHPHTNG
ncbi:reverse transcriptase domain-containing protein [Tanacetum coccineum]